MVNAELDEMGKFNLKLEVAVDLEELLNREVDIIIFNPFLTGSFFIDAL